MCEISCKSDRFEHVMVGKMEDSKIYEELVEILKHHTKHPEFLINSTMESHIVNDVKVKSIRLVDVFLECEDKYGILFADDEIDQLRTIGEVITAIKIKISEPKDPEKVHMKWGIMVRSK